MSYVFDTSPLSTLFRNFYPNVFRQLWHDFDRLVADSEILSTREVRREIDASPIASMRQWADEHPDLFPSPGAAEAQFVTRVFQEVPHFQNVVEGKKLLAGGLLADPFVIARAHVEGATVVTMETLKPNAADIPNICQHYDIAYMSLQEFMEDQGWQF